MDNLSTFLTSQYAAQREQELAQLKKTYEKGEQAIDEQIAALPAQYSSARNDTAAQNAIAKKNFNEQAAATGLNSGTSGQAELARSNAYMSAIANLNRSEAEANQKLERDRVNWKNDYENAIAASSAANDAALNSALYQEMIRQQNAQYQADRDAIADSQWQKQYDEALRQYEQNLKYQADRNAVEDSRWQAQFDEALRQYEDNLKYQADRDKIEDDRWQKQFEEAIRQYNQDYAFTQQKYMDAMGANAAASTGSAGGSTGGNETAGGVKYNAPGYSEEQIKRMQKAAGIEVDGIWGPQTQAAYDAGYRPSVELTQQMLAKYYDIHSYGATAEEGVRKMIANGESEDRLFAYIDELTHANYLTPSENTNIKLKIRSGSL